MHPQTTPPPPMTPSELGINVEVADIPMAVAVCGARRSSIGSRRPSVTASPSRRASIASARRSSVLSVSDVVKI